MNGLGGGEHTEELGVAGNTNQKQCRVTCLVRYHVSLMIYVNFSHKILWYQLKCTFDIMMEQLLMKSPYYIFGDTVKPVGTETCL